MATATRPKPTPPKTVTQAIREDVRGHGPLPSGVSRVDREAGVIRGCRVTGTLSANRRKYPAETLRAALPMYEGVAVRVDHSARQGTECPSDSVFGWLRGARQGDDGAVYADLHYLKSHPLAERVCEAAERNPELYGLSHEAKANGHMDTDGYFVVERILEVSVVSLVAEPATNKSMFEERQISTPKKITIAALLEQLSSNTKLPKPVRKALLEMDVDGCTKEVDEPADAPAAATADPLAMLAQAAAALAASGDAAQHEMGMKILKLLKPESAETPEADDEDDGDGEEKDGDGEKKPFESKKKGGKARKPAAPRPAVVTEARAKALIALAGVQESRDLLDAVCGIDEARAISVIQLAKGKQTQAAPRGPRSAPAGTVGATATVTESKIPDESKALASWLNSK